MVVDLLHGSVHLVTRCSHDNAPSELQLRQGLGGLLRRRALRPGRQRVQRDARPRRAGGSVLSVVRGESRRRVRTDSSLHLCAARRHCFPYTETVCSNARWALRARIARTIVVALRMADEPQLQPAAPAPPRPPTRLELLLREIWLAQREQSTQLQRLQDGVDRLLARDSSELPVLAESQDEPAMQLPWTSSSAQLASLTAHVSLAHTESQRIATAAASAAAAATAYAEEAEHAGAVDAALLNLVLSLSTTPSRSSTAPPPASEQAISSVPLIEGDKELKESACPVCLAELGEGSLSALPCGAGAESPHVFHASCLREWLSRHNSCPTCRAPLP